MEAAVSHWNAEVRKRPRQQLVVDAAVVEERRTLNLVREIGLHVVRAARPLAVRRILIGRMD
jgi:hypothetical protein